MIVRKLEQSEVDGFYKKNPTDYAHSGPDVPNAVYFGVEDSNKVIASTYYVPVTDNLVHMQGTMITPEYRGKGVGRFLNIELEKHLINEGFGKIVSYIYVENLPSIILKLKLGYLVEGTLRDHDYMGQHEYVLGKILKGDKEK